MIIRKMTPAEQIEYSGICSIAFLYKASADIRAQMKDPQAHIKDNDNGDEDRWGAFDDNGKMHSALIVNHYDMLMNGKAVKMGGIGGVVTLPESRGQGLIRKIFDAAFPAMLENGQTFSFLYPFSYSYYRMFGYEMCYTYNSVNIPIAEIKGYPYPKNIKSFEPGDDIAPFAEIYEAFTHDRNLAMVRDEDAWKEMLNRDPYKELKFTYLNHDDRGKADAYVLYGVQKNDEHGNRLKIKELCWRTVEGLHSIFGFFSKLGSEYDSIDWNAPDDINVHALFPEAYDVKWSKNASGMNRILDVTAGLSTLRTPAMGGNGKLTLDIADKYWGDNSGKYTVQWEDGKLTVRKATTGDAAMATSVETLAQLVTGYMSPEEVALKTDTTIYSNHLLLSQLFPKQKLHMTERF